MPKHRTRDRRLRACAERSGAVLCGLAASWFILTGGGCRALRCHQASDESVAAARQLSLQGLDARQHGRWDQAEALFASAVEQCPQDERARCGFAESLWERGAQDQAVVHMEEAVRLSGNDPERLVQLGGMYLARGELHRAGQQADKAIAANGQLASAWALRGRVLQAQGQRSEALASFHRALSYRDHYPEVQLAIAEIYGQQNRPQRALATLQALAASFPPGQAPVEILVREGFALRDLGRFQDAVRTLAQATQQGNPSAELYYELARTHLLTGDAAAARLSLAAALDRDPSHAGSLALQHELAAQQGIVAAVSASRISRE